MIFQQPAPSNKDVLQTLAFSVDPKDYLASSSFQVDRFSFTVAGRISLGHLVLRGSLKCPLKPILGYSFHLFKPVEARDSGSWENVRMSCLQTTKKVEDGKEKLQIFLSVKFLALLPTGATGNSNLATRGRLLNPLWDNTV